MPTDRTINEAWLIAATGTFAVKGIVFAVLAGLIVYLHRRYGVPLASLSRYQSGHYGTTAAVSFGLATLFGVASAARPSPNLSVIPIWLWVAIRLVILVAPWGSIGFGALVVVASWREATLPTVAQQVATGRAEGHAEGVEDEAKRQEAEG